MIEPEFVDEERIDVLERDEQEQADTMIQQETSFNDDVVIQQEPTEIELRRREKKLE